MHHPVRMKHRAAIPFAAKLQVGLLVSTLWAASILLLQPTAGAATNSFFPLWQKNPPNAADMVLIYQGGTGRLPWTPDQFKPYVSYRDPRDSHEKWLFDGFLFIEYHDRKRTFSGTEGKGKWTPADKNDWLKLLDKNFEGLADGHHFHGVPALEQCVAKTEKRIGAPLRQRQVILTLPEPVENFTNWGELDGRKLDFSVLADRRRGLRLVCQPRAGQVARACAETSGFGRILFCARKHHGFEPANASAGVPKNSRARAAVFLDSFLAHERGR